MISKPFATLLAAIAAVSSLAVVLIATNRTATSVGAAPYVLPDEVTRPDTIWLDEMTWTEVSLLVDAGVTTVIIPTAGVEQNGPHLPLGKHEVVVRHTAERIARTVGDTVVATPITYVPEGDLDSGTGHAGWPGTLTLSEGDFEAILESAARSLHAAGFTTVAFLGDSAFNQVPQERVADQLRREWDDTSVISMHRYYYGNGQVDHLRDLGFTDAEIGGHAGIRDTSELLALAPELVRLDLLDAAGAPGSGSTGDATLATAALGRVMLDLKVAAGTTDLERALTDS